jgi:predicted molibdopterin-dependent oxidoreductase YjgC
MITGNIGFEGTGVNPLRGQNNVQGACDMGGLPNVHTGYQRVNLPEIRKKFADYWGVKEEAMSLDMGMTLTTMIPEAGNKIKALYVLGENPLVSDPNLHHVRECMEKLDCLIVQDIFLTETAQVADVVLPAVSFAEKRGTVTNTERRVQFTQQAIQPVGDVRQDYEIIADIAARLGHQFPRTPEGLFQEIRDLTPAYKGITYDRIREVGIMWPCPNTDHPGTRFLHRDKFVSGKGTLSPLKYLPPAEEPDSAWPMVLSTGRILQHYHTGSMTRRAQVLDAIVKSGHVELNPDDAAGLGVVSGDRVRVVTRRGSIETEALVQTRVAKGSIFVPFHFAEAAANELTNDALDPVAKIPELKVCAARIEKAH